MDSFTLFPLIVLTVFLLYRKQLTSFFISACALDKITKTLVEDT